MEQLPNISDGESRYGIVEKVDGVLHEAEIIISSTGGNCYEIIKKLRKSIFGAVHVALQVSCNHETGVYSRSDTPKTVAVKTYDKHVLLQQNNLEDPFADISALQSLGTNENIVNCIECFETANTIYLVMEYCSGGELYDLITQKGALSEELAVPLIRGIVSGIRIIHAADMAHRDISMENVILTKDFSVGKVIDFGACVHLSRSDVDGGILPIHQQSYGKRNYKAPEVITNNGPYDPQKSDCWALGVLIFVVITGICPFNDAADFDAGFRYFRAHGIRQMANLDWSLGLSDEVLDLIGGLLRINTDDRMTIERVAIHPWLNHPL